MANATWACPNGTDHLANCSATCDGGLAGGFTALCSSGAYAAPSGGCSPQPPCTSSWAPAGQDLVERNSAMATLLSTSKMLVAGGVHWGSAVVNATPFSPDQGTFSAAAAMPRSHGTATATANGSRVLLAGGGSSGPSASANVYETAADVWTSVTGLATARHHHAAALISTTGDVLVIGGRDDNGDPQASAERFDVAANAFVAAGNLSEARYWATATALPGGKVLVVGGVNGFNSISSAELWANGAFTPAANLSSARYQHRAAALPSGDVLVLGGNTSSQTTTSAELHLAASDTWVLAGNLTTPRADFTATVPQDGKVLVCGGVQGKATVASCESWDPASPTTWMPVAADCRAPGPRCGGARRRACDGCWRLRNSARWRIHHVLDQLRALLLRLGGTAVPHRLLCAAS